MRNTWTREGIIRHLLEREAKGLPLTVGGAGVDRLLYLGSRRIFGSWRNAVQAAGIAPERGRSWDRWPPTKILMTIRRLAKRSQPLSAAQMERRYGTMISTARRLFGTWAKAVLAAGVDPARLQRAVPWNQERVLEAILTRALRNESLAARLVEPRSLVVAGKRFFGSWPAAVTAAGLDPKLLVPPAVRGRPRAARAAAPHAPSPHRPRQLWTKELVIAAIQVRYRNRQSMIACVVDRDDCGLYRATRRHLQGWANALLEAGLDPAVLAPNSKVKPPVSDSADPSARQAQSHGATRPDRPT